MLAPQFTTLKPMTVALEFTSAFAFWHHRICTLQVYTLITTLLSVLFSTGKLAESTAGQHFATWPHHGNLGPMGCLGDSAR